MRYFHHLKVFIAHKSSLAVGVAFILLGFLFGNWATMIPYVKSTFELDDAVLGLVLLSMPLGAMIFNPFTALLIQKYGMNKVTVASMVYISLAYMMPLSTSVFAIVPLGLVLCGIGITALNISMNTCASSIEQYEKINIMSTCHGLFSLGLMSGSIAGSTSTGAGIDPGLHMFFMGIIGLILTWAVRPAIMRLHDSGQRKDKVQKFRLFIPRGALLLMIVISICINVTEGSMADWTALYMKEIVNSGPYFIGWGLAGYSLFMALGRFAGDGLIPVLGGNKILIYGAILVITGFIISIMIPTTFFAVVGFAFVGLGVSCGAPILYGSAGRIPDMPRGTGLAIMNTFAMGGFLIGPVIIGFISDITSLVFAFSFVAFLAAVWLVFATKVRLY